MIFFRTDIGRLGNKMFIYACAFANAQERGINFCVNEPILFDFFKMGSYGKQKNFIFLKYFWWIIHKYFFKGNVDLTNCNIIHTNDKFIDNTITTGYFQSPIYFEQYKQQVAKLFVPRTHYIKKYLEISRKLNPKLSNMVIHIRRTDYHTHQPNDSSSIGCTVPLSYYQKIFSLEPIVQYNLIFISDDIAFCKTQFSYLDNAYFSESEQIIDLQFMINAAVCVISNSTFSWWGAYLNTVKSKAYAPKYFLGIRDKKEYPIHIYPREWIQIEI